MAINIFLITFSLVIYTCTVSGLLYFPVSYIRFSPYTGFYVTRVKLGNPSKEFTVLIDTGSDLFWIACDGCTGCPSSSRIYGIELKFYDSSKSSTASLVGCLDPKCSTLQSGNKTCAKSNSSSCTYWVQYAQDSTTQGYYVSDIMHINTVAVNFSIIFGCSMLQSGVFTHPEDTFDGIFGLGLHGLLLSQLSTAGIFPKMFTLCLDGSEDDASFLYFGEIEEPDIVYTPLIPSKSRYCLNLQSMHVNDQKLNINSSVFTTPTVPGVVFDTGTTLAYLPHEAYHHFINAINSSLKPQTVEQYEGFAKRPCFMTQSSIDDVFPTVKLHFAGGAEMKLYPKIILCYSKLLKIPLLNGVWFGWMMDDGFGTETVLGDIALKDKVLVHDLANMRIGWKEQKCSAQVNFSSGQIWTSSSSWKNHKALVIIVSIAVFLFVVLILSICCVHRCR